MQNRSVTHCVLSVTILVATIATASANDIGRTAIEPASLSVLFFGNSHLIAHDVPRRVSNRLRAQYRDGTTVRVRRVGFNGARLSQFVKRPSVQGILAKDHWDVVVLQEATASFLTPALRRQFQASVKWFRTRLPPETRVVLFQTWAWRDHHRYFRKDLSGGPRGEDSFWTFISDAYDKAAARNRIVIAPVGRCWRRESRVRSLYSRDGNHATVAGSDYAADIIARTISTGQPGRC